MIWPTVIETPRAMQAVERDDFADEPQERVQPAGAAPAPRPSLVPVG